MKTNQLIPLLNPFSETLKEIINDSAIKQTDMASATGILASHISEMKHGKRRCTPEYDLRLSRFLGMSPGFFLRLQTHHDIEVAQRERGDAVAKTIVPWGTSA
jgi:addiction module HigA family antidote